MSSETEKLAAAMKAVRHVLARVCNEPDVAFLLGACTESYKLLCAAVATESGRPEDQVEDTYPPASPDESRSASRPTPMAVCDQLDTTTAAVCEGLAVAPLIAAELLRFAESRDIVIPHPRRDPEDGRLEVGFLERCDHAWSEWSTSARARGLQIH